MLVANEWKIHFSSLPIYGRIDGPMRRVDIRFEARVNDAGFVVPPHGIVGQSFDEGKIRRNGKVDTYPPQNTGMEFTTTSMGEGAIQGTADEYEIKSPNDTNFKYSAFNKYYKRTQNKVAILEHSHASASVLSHEESMPRHS